MRNIIFALLMGILTSSVVCAKSHTNYDTTHYFNKRGKGLKKTEESKKRMKAFKHVSFMTQKTPIPGLLDLSDKISPPEDQGQCGACWDFSLTKALRSEYMLYGEDPGQLEFNYLLNNCGPGPSMNGCNGGDFTAAISFEYGSGPGLNSEDPFHARVGSCKNLAVKATAVSYSMLGEGNKPPTFQDLAYAIGVEKHVLSIDVAAAKGDWESYSGGIYDHCVGGEKDIDHMINLVGYDCQTSLDESKNCVFDAKGAPKNGDGYVIVMNNWGNDWGTEAASGHKGYMKTRLYDKKGNHCNALATDALFFEITPPSFPVVNPSITPEPSPSECSGFLCNAITCALPWCLR